MADERYATNMRKLFQLLGLEDDIVQDSEEARTYCTLHDQCVQAKEYLTLYLTDQRYRCEGTSEEGSFSELIKALESKRSELSPVLEGTLLPAEASEPNSPEPAPSSFQITVRASNPVAKTKPKVLQLKPGQRLPTPEEIAAEREERLAALRAQQAEKRRGRGERLVIGALGLAFVIAGLAAGGLSGFANYQAFSATVSDPVQGRIWGWAGVIAAVVSFGGFTFVYWHGANRRMKEAFRALVFALVGAGASILGTEIYIRSNAEAAAAAVATAGSNRAVLESQITDWRRQLEGIPPETRSVEGLEAYLAEVERVGRTDHKPYRDAQNELGLARRRDDLAARIEAANAELLGQGSGNILLQADQRAALPSWLFAALLELFSSQATSIGLVALLLLSGAGRRAPD